MWKSDTNWILHVKNLLHAVSIRDSYIIPRATDPRSDIGRGLIQHVIQFLTCNVHFIIYFNHTPSMFCEGCAMGYVIHVYGMQYKVDDIGLKLTLIMHVQCHLVTALFDLIPWRLCLSLVSRSYMYVWTLYKFCLSPCYRITAPFEKICRLCWFPLSLLQCIDSI